MILPPDPTTNPLPQAKPGAGEIENELEIELSSAAVREQGRRVVAGEPHKLTELVQGLVDNVRLLARNVPGPNTAL